MSPLPLNLESLDMDSLSHIASWSSPSDLRNLSLCCCALRTMLLPLIFHDFTVKIDGYRMTKEFERVITKIGSHIWVLHLDFKVRLSERLGLRQYDDQLQGARITISLASASLRKVTITNSDIGLHPLLRDVLASCASLASLTYHGYGISQPRYPLSSFPITESSYKLEHIHLYPGEWGISSLHNRFVMHMPTVDYLDVDYRAESNNVLYSLLTTSTSSLKDITIPPSSALLQHLESSQWPSLRRLSIRGVCKVTDPLLNFLRTSSFPQLDVLAVEALLSGVTPENINDVGHHQLLGPETDLSNIRHLTCVNMPMSQGLIRRLPRTLCTLSMSWSSILQQASPAEGTEHPPLPHLQVPPSSDNVASLFDSEALSPPGPFHDMRFLRVQVSTEPTTLLFNSISRACPSLERLDVHCKVKCPLFLHPEDVGSALKSLASLKVLCLDADWNHCHDAITFVHPKGIPGYHSPWHQLLDATAQRLGAILPGLCRVCFSFPLFVSGTKGVLRSDLEECVWQICHLRQESFTMGALNKMNTETDVWYHGEFVHSESHYDIIGEGIPKYNPYFSRWTELVYPTSQNGSSGSKRTRLTHFLTRNELSSLAFRLNP